MGAATAGVAAGIALMLLLAGLGSGGSGDGGAVESRFVEDEFEVGRTERLADQIDAGGPILLPDAGPGRSKDVYVQHGGPGPDEGWLVFDARPEGAGRECTLRWDASDAVFVDPCTGDEHPPDGGSLTHYETRVDDGRLYVDLRAPRSR